MFVVTSTSKSTAQVLVFVTACLKMNPAHNYWSEHRMESFRDNVLNSNCTCKYVAYFHLRIESTLFNVDKIAITVLLIQLMKLILGYNFIYKTEKKGYFAAFLLYFVP